MMVSPLAKMACGVACLGGIHYYVAPTVLEACFFWGWERTERKITKQKEAFEKTQRYLRDNP